MLNGGGMGAAYECLEAPRAAHHNHHTALRASLSTSGPLSGGEQLWAALSLPHQTGKCVWSSHGASVPEYQAKECVTLGRCGLLFRDLHWTILFPADSVHQRTNCGASPKLAGFYPFKRRRDPNPA